jgi:hypothetical protein
MMGNASSEQQQSDPVSNDNDAIISIEALANLNDVSSSNGFMDQHFLYWDQVNYAVNDPLQGHLTIINNVSGFAKGGRLLAIMGSSGNIILFSKTSTCLK